MATIVIDELVTKLEYEADVKTIETAEKAVKQLEKSNEQTAKATDLLTREQLALAEEIAKTQAKTNALRDSKKRLQAQIKRTGKASTDEKNTLESLNAAIDASQKRTRELRNDSAALSRQKQRLGLQSRKLASDQRKLASAVRKASEGMREETSVLDSLGQKIAGVAGGELAADAVRSVATGVFELGKEVVTTGANFESLRARLKTVEGSSEGAAKAFGLIQDFTKTTPFQLEEVTTAFVRLKSLGLDASKESLTAFGNLSAAQGKSIIDFIEAVADASTGEFERLKEFGIKASSQGDKVAFTFKGQTTTVGKNATEIQQFLKNIGETEFAGAMADQMATLNGVFSNFQDMVAQAFDEVARMGVLDEVKLLVKALSEAIGGGDGLAALLAGVLTTGLRTVREIIATLPQDALVSFFSKLVELIGVLAPQLSKASAAGGEFFSLLVSLVEPLLTVVTAAANLIMKVEKLADELPAIPGPLKLIITALELTAKAMSIVAEGIEIVLNFLSDLLSGLTALAKESEILNFFSGLADRIRGVDAAVIGLNTDLSDTAAFALNAADAIKKLDVARLTEAARRGSEAAKQELRRRAGVAAEQEVAAEQAAKIAQEQAKRRKALDDKREKQLSQFEGAKIKDRSADSLRALAQDQSVPEKVRKRAEKELDRRERDRKKKGAAAAKKERQGLVTVQVEKQIEDLAKKAGEREASRALLRGESATRANELQRMKRKEVQERFTRQFQETGQLPPGLATSLTQTAALPDVEKVAGPVSAPVLTVNNYRTEVTGNTIVNEVNVAGGVSATPEQITGAIAQSQAVTFADLGAAIVAKTTNLRR